MFNSLSDRLTDTFKNLRTKGRLTESDVNKTVREIRLALLDADVALPVVKEFTAVVRERALGAEVSEALNPAQQVVKIVNEELVGILGGETRGIQFAKQPPTVIMLAGLQGSGKTTLAGKLGAWLKAQGHTPLLVAADLQRPNAVTQLRGRRRAGRRAGVRPRARQRLRPRRGHRERRGHPQPRRPGRGLAGRHRAGPPRAARRRHRRHRRPPRRRRRT